jgi:predicted DNA binding CopG/RHH family protein
VRDCRSKARSCRRPEPSTLDAVMELPDSKGGVAIRVAVKTQAPKCIRVNVTLPEDILERIDKSATSRGLTRSAFLTRAAKRELEVT